MSTCDEKDLSNVAVSFVTAGGGVVGTTDYLVQAQGSPNNTVLVNTGKAYVPTADGTMVYATRMDATQNVTIAANSSGNPRVDSVVLYCDLSASPDPAADNVAKFFAVQGTPGGSPVAPTNAQILAAIGAGNPYIVLATINVANGFTSINSGNITDARAFARISGGDSVFQSDFANYVHSGLTIPTSASLTTTAAAGVIYFNGNKVSVSTDNGHTYTASSDTYVDVSNTGVFTYSGVANGAAAPALTASSIRIAKVVTSGTAVTGVLQAGWDSNFVRISPPSPLAAFFAQNTPGVTLNKSATQSIATGAWTALVWDVEVTNSAGMHNGTNNTRITFPSAGMYLVTFNGEWTASTTAQRLAALQVNGTTREFQLNEAPGDQRQAFTLTALRKFSAGDYVEAVVFQNTGSSLNFINSNGSESKAWFNAQYVGAGM